MYKVCKIRCYPNKTQLKVINETFGACRYVKNLYIEYNQKIYAEEKRFLSGYDFAKIITKLKKENEKFKWMQNYSSKAIKNAIMEEEKAFKKFFKKRNGFPRFKSRKRLTKESYYFIKDSIHLTDNPRIITIPILGKIRITENSYLPDILSIISGRVIREYDKYYLMFIYNVDRKYIELNNISLGIDVGIKKYASIALENEKGDVITQQVNHFISSRRYRKIENRIKRLQQIISNKSEMNYGKLLNNYLTKHGEDPCENIKNIMKGESYNSSRIRIIQKKVRNLKKKLRNIRQDYIYKLVYFLTARTKPKKITIENLDVSEMIKHGHEYEKELHAYIQNSGFYMFKECIKNSSIKYGITLRIADKYFASSKLCSCCGNKKDDLKLTDRVYHCEKCGAKLDRDINAAINLLHMKDKKCTVIA